MAKQFNPFHHWLGFDEELRNPNHFQLFGVKPNSDDPIGFRKRIHTRAKSMLKKLELMTEEEVGERRKLHTKLRRHIVKAHETLLDTKLKEAYLKGLRQKAREAKGSAKPLAVPAPRVSSSALDGEAAQTGSFDDKTFKDAVTHTVKQQSDMAQPSDVVQQDPSTSLPQGQTAAIPMAIPLKKPDAPDNFEPSADADPNTGPNFDNLEDQVLVRPTKLKRQKSYLIPILMLIMTLFCVAVIGALVTNFSNILVSKPTPEVNTNGDNENAKPVVPLADANAALADPLASEDAEDPVVPPTADEIKKATEELVNTLPEGKDNETSVAATGNPARGGANSGAKANLNPKARTKPKLSTLVDSHLQPIRFLLTRARKEMVRGRLESAAEQYKIAQAIIVDNTAIKPSIFNTSVGVRGLSKNQSAIVSEIRNGLGMVKHLTGFWEQVARSSQKFRGGELEPEPGVFVGFVEGRADDVVLRFGENVAIPYRSLRPGLAMTLAPMKAVPNVAEWNMQEAAFRLIHSNGSDKTKAKIEALLASAESYEYDVSAIRGFMDPGDLFDFAEPTRTAIDEDQMSEMKKTLVGRKYNKFSRLKPGVAWEHAKAFSSATYDNPMMRATALHETVNLSQHSGDAFQMVDAIDELAKWIELNTSKRKADGFAKIAKKQPQGVYARLAGEAFFEFLKSDDAESLPEKELAILKQQMLQMVASNQLDDLRRLISQTMN